MSILAPNANEIAALAQEERAKEIQFAEPPSRDALETLERDILRHRSDFEVRFYAVVGIAKVVRQPGWQPNMIDFTRDQDKYLKHWKEWGQTR